MDLDTALKFLQGVGFPAAVAMFVLVRVEARLRELGEAVAKLATAIEVLEVKTGAKA